MKYRTSSFQLQMEGEQPGVIILCLAADIDENRASLIEPSGSIKAFASVEDFCCILNALDLQNSDKELLEILVYDAKAVRNRVVSANSVIELSAENLRTLGFQALAAIQYP